MEKILGEKRMRVDLEATKSSTVDIINSKTAELINVVNELPVIIDSGETARLKAMAITHYELAALIAVKAAMI